MAQFFDYIIRFSYSSGLHQHLKGLDPIKCEYIGTNVYAWILCWMLPIAFLFMLNYYFGLFKSPRFSKFWAWILNVLVACLITFFLANMHSDNDLRHNNYCKAIHFNSMDCFLFACTVATYTFIFCFIFSFAMKYISLNHKKIPF